VFVLEHPGWIIAFFAIAAVVVLGIGGLQILSAARKLQAHLEHINSAPVIADAAMIGVRAERLSNLQPRVEELQARIAAASQQLRDAGDTFRLRPGSTAVSDAAEDVRDLITDLR